MIFNDSVIYRIKSDYLSQVPNINNPGVKSHEKYKGFSNMVTGQSKGGEVAKK